MVLEDLELSTRAEHCLIRAGIHTVEDLCNCTEDKLLCLRAFGPGCLQEVKDKLKARGLKLKRY